MKVDILKKETQIQLLEAIKYGQNRFRLFNQAR